jgi:hypothetical protein
MPVNRQLPRQRPKATPTLLLADLGVMALCVTAMFWLLASPLIPIMFTLTGLLIWTVVLGVPLGIVGVVLNHRAAESEARKRR